MGTTTGPWKVGELANATGLTVRTLHHYDEIGLLRPTQHTDCGHRLYTKHDLARLQQILGLRQLGFSLDQVAGAFYQPDFSPLSTIASLRKDLCQRRAEIDRFDERLADVERIMSSGGEVSAGRLIELIERTAMYERYLTSDQLAVIKARTEALSSARAREATEREWPELIAAVKAEAEQGTDPADPRVQVLARRWKTLTDEFTGSDPGINSRLNEMYEHDADAFAKDKVSGYGEAAVVDLARCVRYIGQAIRAGSVES